MLYISPIFFNTDDVNSLKSRIVELEEKEEKLLAQQTQNETEFGQKRARFREMFLQKEGKSYMEICDVN